MNGGVCSRPCGKVRRCLNGGILCSALSLRCLGWWRRKLNEVGFLKGSNDLLRSTTHEARKKRLLFRRHISERTIQVPTPSLQVRLREFGNLERRINTEIGVDIDPMEKEIWQARRR